MSCNCSKPEIEEKMGRRGFLNRLILGISGFIGAVLSVPLIMGMLDPVIRKRNMVWREIGKPEDFPVGKTKMVTYENPSLYDWGKEISRTAAYIRKQENGELLALTVNCSHLGCPVRWVEKAEMFLCPCHGGAFYKDGSRAAGAPTKPLVKYSTRIVNNKVEILTEKIPITTLG